MGTEVPWTQAGEGKCTGHKNGFKVLMLVNLGGGAGCACV